jgi:hypothetical protein
MGKPVVGTGYSGNMDFTIDQNSYLSVSTDGSSRGLPTLRSARDPATSAGPR